MLCLLELSTQLVATDYHSYWLPALWTLTPCCGLWLPLFTTVLYRSYHLIVNTPYGWSRHSGRPHCDHFQWPTEVLWLLTFSQEHLWWRLPPPRGEKTARRWPDEHRYIFPGRSSLSAVSSTSSRYQMLWETCHKIHPEIRPHSLLEGGKQSGVALHSARPGSQERNLRKALPGSQQGHGCPAHKQLRCCGYKSGRSFPTGDRGCTDCGGRRRRWVTFITCMLPDCNLRERLCPQFSSCNTVAMSISETPPAGSKEEAGGQSQDTTPLAIPSDPKDTNSLASLLLGSNDVELGNMAATENAMSRSLTSESHRQGHSRSCSNTSWTSETRELLRPKPLTLEQYQGQGRGHSRSCSMTSWTSETRELLRPKPLTLENQGHSRSCSMGSWTSEGYDIKRSRPSQGQGQIHGHSRSCSLGSWSSEVYDLQRVRSLDDEGEATLHGAPGRSARHKGYHQVPAEEQENENGKREFTTYWFGIFKQYKEDNSFWLWPSCVVSSTQKRPGRNCWQKAKVRMWSVAISCCWNSSWPSLSNDSTTSLATGNSCSLRSCCLLSLCVWQWRLPWPAPTCRTCPPW